MKHSGFSLVELSIVLVILGLLVGGILAGQSLIRAAELRSVATEYSKYTTATYAFRDKYFAIPGDMANATSVWGDNNSLCADPAITNGSPGTCNGNGDRQLVGGLGANVTGEIFQYWTQLMLSGLIEGTYSGAAGTGGAGSSIIGTNVPASKLNQGGWMANQYVGSGTPATDLPAIPLYGNFLSIGAQNGTGGPGAALMKPEEAWNIDTKLDDGRPSYGKIIGKFWNNQCSTPNTGVASQTNLDASYKLSDTSNQCMLLFVNLW